MFYKSAHFVYLVQEYRDFNGNDIPDPGEKIGEQCVELLYTVTNGNNSRPRLSGMSGLDVYTTNICADAPFCFEITASDVNIDDELTMTWGEEIEGATFESAVGDYPIIGVESLVGQFCWTPTIADTGSHYFTATVRDNVCPINGVEVATYVLVVYPPAHAPVEAIEDIYICEGDVVELSAISPDGSILGSYWSPEALVENPFSFNTFTVPLTETTTFAIIAAHYDECVSIDSVTVFVEPVPTVSIVQNPSFFCGSSVTLTAVSSDDVTDYFWLPGGFSGGQSIVVAPFVATEYTVIVSNAIGCTASSSIFVSYSPPTNIYLTAYLEGTYDSLTGMMHTQLRDAELLPLLSTYNNEPWEATHSGFFSEVSDMPAHVSDYVLIEILDEAGEIVVQTDALVLHDGTITSIQNPDLGAIESCFLEEGTFYNIIVRHRNHLAVLSSSMAMVSDGELHYDFSCAMTQAAGLNQLTQLAPDIFGLKAGDIDGNGVMTLSDFNIYTSESDLVNVYARSDLNADGQVNEADFDLYFSHVTDMGVWEVRY